MEKHKRNLLNKSIVVGLIIWLTLGIGLVAAETATGRLTLSLQPSLDDDGDIKATSITTAELLSTSGAIIKTATVTGGTAQFDLSGVAAGDYFIRVNALADDLVPTRIDDTTKAISQFVGQKLRMTFIGKSLSDHTYLIKTFSKGQGEHPVVKYSDGTNVMPERYAYALHSLKNSSQDVEVRVLGTAALLTSLTLTPGTSPHNFSTWVLGIGENHHGEAAKANSPVCSACHGNPDVRPARYQDINSTNGWCSKCHYGKEGDPNGFVDPTFSISAATPTTVISTPAATTTKPTATPTHKAPAFEMLFAVGAILVAVLVRRRQN